MTVAMVSWLQKFNSKNFCYALNSQLKKRCNRARRKKQTSVHFKWYVWHSFFSIFGALIHDLFIISFFFYLDSICCSILHAFVGRHQHQRCNVEIEKSAEESSVGSRLFLFWLFYLFVLRRTLVCAAATRKLKGAMNRQFCRCSECTALFGAKNKWASAETPGEMIAAQNVFRVCGDGEGVRRIMFSTFEVRMGGGYADTYTRVPDGALAFATSQRMPDEGITKGQR